MPRSFEPPLQEGFVEIDGGVRERGEDEHLLVRLAELVVGGVGNPGTDELLEFVHLGVGGRSHVLRCVEQDAKLILVLLQLLQPIVEAKMFELVFQLATDL